MTMSLAPTLPSEETACVSVPATSATLLATFAAVLLAPSATACACAKRVLSVVRTGRPLRPRHRAFPPVILSHTIGANSQQAY